jgi:hypothetical protein
MNDDVFIDRIIGELFMSSSVEPSDHRFHRWLWLEAEAPLRG